jgi:hypothetical protein
MNDYSFQVHGVEYLVRYERSNYGLRHYPVDLWLGNRRLWIWDFIPLLDRSNHGLRH